MTSIPASSCLLREISICCITVLRIVFTFVLIRNQEDSTYWIAINAIYLTLEPNLGMVNACLLLLKPLLHRLRPKLSWASHIQNTPAYPLSSRNCNSPNQFSQTRYGLRRTDSSRNFTKLEDWSESRSEAARALTKGGSTDSRRLTMLSPSISRSAYTENEISAESRDVKLLPAGGITITRTLDVELHEDI
jgi:hypothetical protein